MLKKRMVGDESVAHFISFNDLMPRTYPITGHCNHYGNLTACPHLYIPTPLYGEAG